MIKKLLVISVSLTLVYGSLNAQWWKGKRPEQVNLLSVGFAADGAITMHSGDFILPYAPTCCTSYTTALGFGPALSGFISNEFTKNIRGILRLTYSPYGGTFTTDQDILVTNSTPGTTRHTLETSMTFVGAELLADFRVSEGLRLMIGGSAGAMAQATYSQKEELIQPGVGTFENGRRVRNETNNQDMQNLTNPILGVTGGVGYDFPMTENYATILTPEILYTFGISNIIEGQSWKANQIRVGVSVGFALNAPEPPLPVMHRKIDYIDSVFAQLPPDGEYKRVPGAERIQVDTVIENDTVTITDYAYRTDTVFRPARPQLEAHMSAKALLADGTLNNEFAVDITTQFVTEALPLLPVVFFDAQAISLSFRYHQVSSPSGFDMQSIPSRTTSVHRDVLNIIGQRMKENPSASISLVGSADPTTEGGNCDLATKRAEEVKKYLVNVWGIDGSRIEVVQRTGSCVPDRVTKEPSEAGFSENRRVDIETKDLDLLAPVAKRRFNEARYVTPPRIVLDPSGTTSRSPIDNVPTEKFLTSWKIEGKSGQTILFSYDEKGAPKSVTQELTTATADLMKDGEPLKVQFTVEGPQGSIASTEATLPVRRDTLKTELERLTLTLFDVSSDEVTPISEEQIKKFIENVPAGSSVKVRGYADMLGNAEFNRKLSQKRAQSVCNTINKYLTKQISVDCTEVATNLYPPGIDSYDTPEERFLSRTVQIEVKHAR